MTTPPTPAGWYPDPEQAGQLRYYDGFAWTEHRTPIQQPVAPAAPEPPAAPSEPARPSFPAGSGAHRAPDAEPEPPSEPESEPPSVPEPDPQSLTEQPTTKVPLREWSFEPPPLEPDATPSWRTEPTSTPDPTPEPTPEPPVAPPPEPPVAPPPPLTEQPTAKVQLRDWSDPTPESAPYADATTPTPPEPQFVEPPAGTEPRVPVDNRKLLMGFGGAVAALLVVLVLAAVYAFVIHKPNSVDLSSPSTETSTTTTEEATTSEETTASETALAPPPAGSATDGPLTFTVVGVESGTTVTSTENDFLTKDAQGEYIVVRLTVQNTSPDPGQFLGTFQKLNAAGQQFTIDDQATFYVGGGFVDLPPGGEAQVGLAYDVPPGTVPESVELHADPISPGVVLPVA